MPRIPDDTLLVSIDVENLYPFILQTDLLQVVYNKMSDRHLILFDPNLVIKLLHLCINYSYFQYVNLTFQQTKGTAMGVAFSPSVANIYMSINFRHFLRSQQKKP